MKAVAVLYLKMNLTELPPLLDLAHGLAPVAAVGAFFPFLKKEKQETLGKGRLQAINQAVYKFLEVRNVENFKVYTIAYDNQPVVLIQAVPQKKLRFSNIIEIQIKKFLRDSLSIEMPAVFWRFKTDYSEEPGPEQADYEFDEQPQYPQDSAAAPAAETEGEAKAAAENHEHENYAPPHLTLKNVHVEEIDISMGEFEEFLKGASGSEKKDEQP